MNTLRIIRTAALAPFLPMLAFAAGQSAEVEALLNRVETCAHFAGEEATDDARRAEIMRALETSGCDTLQADVVKALQKHSGNAVVVKAIQDAMQPLGGVVVPAEPTTHCTSSEEVIFSCTMESSDKTLSICAAPSLAAKKARLIYRFGRIGKIELEYPKRGVTAAKAFWFSSSADQETLRFENGKTAYELVVEDGPARLFVYLPKQKPLPLACRSPHQGGLPRTIEALVPRQVP